ncbi:MAG: CvpA family protein [Thermodesulfobacteriota bacterium]
MNILDIILISLISLFFLIGIWRGLIKQLFSVIALLGGIIVGFIFYNVAAAQILKFNLTDDNAVAAVLGFIIIAAFYYIIVQIIAWFLAKMIGKLQLGWANRLGGGFLGVLIGVIVSHLTVAGLTYFVGFDDGLLKDSKVLPYVKNGYEMIEENIPDDIKSFFKKPENTPQIGTIDIKEI